MSEADFVEVEFQGGIKSKLPPADADAYKAARAKDKAERENLAKRLGELEAMAKAETEAKGKAEEEVRLAKMTSKGEFDKAMALYKETQDAKLKKISENYRDSALKAAIANHPKVSAIADADAKAELVKLFSIQLKSSCGFDIDSNNLQVLGDGGAVALDSESRPVRADAWISSQLDANPILKTQASTGTGAAGAGKTAANTGVAKFSQEQLRGGKIPDPILLSGNYEITD